MRSIWLMVALSAGAAWTPAMAHDRIEIGLLRCSVLEPVEADTGEPGTTGQTRRVSCAFEIESGAEETYVGKVQVANPSLDWKRTLLWSVKAPPGSLTVPGLLQQSYAADPRTPAGQIPDMISESISGIVLETMSDINEGSSSASERQPAPFTVLGVQLELRTTAG